MFYLKERVHPKMKIQSLPTHTHTDGRVGDVFFSPQNTVGVSEEKGFAVISQTIETNGDQDFNVNKMHNKSVK